MLIRFYRSTIGKKVVVALTGALLLLFIVGHMAGNLKTFAGYNSAGMHKLDVYAEFLREIGAELLGHAGFLWFLRIGLLVALVLHVVTIVQLRLINIRSRPDSYRVSKYNSATLASRSMFWGGMIIFAFVIYHILHMTLGTVHFAGFVEGKVYSNVYLAFQNPLVTIVYLVAVGAVGLHLFHGAWSLFQTLGIDDPKRNKMLKTFATALAFIVAIGFMLVPLAVYFDFVPPPQSSVNILAMAE